MQLHQLQSLSKKKKAKRIGRGGKRGTYSGRGIKGQKSRAGRRIRPAERDLIQRLPKLRGFKFKPLKGKPAVFNIDYLAEKIKNRTIDRKALLKAGLITKSTKRVKILGKGELKWPLEIRGLKLSGGALKKIEEAKSNVS